MRESGLGQHSQDVKSLYHEQTSDSTNNRIISLDVGKKLTCLFEKKNSTDIMHFACFVSAVAASNGAFSLPLATAAMYQTVVLPLTFKTCVCRQ